MKRPGEQPKNLTELIDTLDRIREELLTIQRSLENLEDGETPQGKIGQPER